MEKETIEAVFVGIKFGIFSFFFFLIFMYLPYRKREKIKEFLLFLFGFSEYLIMNFLNLPDEDEK